MFFFIIILDLFLSLSLPLHKSIGRGGEHFSLLFLTFLTILVYQWHPLGWKIWWMWKSVFFTAQIRLRDKSFTIIISYPECSTSNPQGSSDVFVKVKLFYSHQFISHVSSSWTSSPFPPPSPSTCPLPPSLPSTQSSSFPLIPYRDIASKLFRTPMLWVSDSLRVSVREKMNHLKLQKSIMIGSLVFRVAIGGGT